MRILPEYLDFCLTLHLLVHWWNPDMKQNVLATWIQLNGAARNFLKSWRTRTTTTGKPGPRAGPAKSSSKSVLVVFVAVRKRERFFRCVVYVDIAYICRLNEWPVDLSGAHVHTTQSFRGTMLRLDKHIHVNAFMSIATCALAAINAGLHVDDACTLV